MAAPDAAALHHAADCAAESEAEQVDVLARHAVSLVQRAQLGQVGQHAIKCVQVGHHSTQQLPNQSGVDVEKNPTINRSTATLTLLRKREPCLVRSNLLP